MDSALLRSFVTAEPASSPTRAAEPVPPVPGMPAKAVSRIYPAVPQEVDDDNNNNKLAIELEQVRQTPKRKGGGASVSTTTITTAWTAADALHTPDLEMSRPGTPGGSPADDARGGGVEVVQSVWDPYMNRFRFLSACLMFFGTGMNDSATGALISYM